ncbi:erythromycin esterase family protein [Geothrix sp. 21YS21S-2]|uniref:erythromycin esterase family protein n=1 Tax=Geothrix sp. 21YS21S-2 TaxID=3068893 RepID=UPI0027B9BA31|nr:erythromycin esterase family protein [Geothrix sp. 21YS21S-2]
MVSHSCDAPDRSQDLREPAPAGFRLILLCTLALVLHCGTVKGTLEGRVQGPDGAFLKGVEVAVFPADMRSPVEAASIAWVRTDSMGAFRIHRPAGAYGISASHPTLAGANVGRVTLTPGETFVLPFPLRLRSGGTVLRGRLGGGKGRPGVEGVIALVPSDGTAVLRFDQVRWVRTRSGAFQVALDEGRYGLSAVGKRGRAPAAWLEVGKSPLEWNPELLPEPSPAPADVGTWIRREAVSLADPERDEALDPALLALARSGQVFGMGEATHGTREFAQLVHLTLMSLAQAGSVRALALEMGLVEAFGVDAYVQGDGPDPLPALPPPFRVLEFRNLLVALRTHNLERDRGSRIRVHGIDMMDPGPPFHHALAFFRRTDPESARVLERRVKGLLLAQPIAKVTAPPNRIAWRAALDGLLARMDARKKAFIRAAGETGFARQRQALVVLGQFIPVAGDVPRGLEARENAMAENVYWVLRQEGVGARVLLWAHNGHITKAAQGPCGFPTLGWRLSQGLGPGYVALGTAFGRGGFLAFRTLGGILEPVPRTVEPMARGTLDAALASTGEPRFFLDLRKVPSAGPVRRWLSEPQGTWFVNLEYDPAHPAESMVMDPVVDRYDALAFFAETAPCQYWTMG